MISYTVLLICFAVLVTSQQFAEDEGRAEHLTFLNATKSLYTELFKTRDYQKELSPIYSKKPIVFQTPTGNVTNRKVAKFHVNITLGYMKIMEVTEQDQLISVIVHFIKSWFDVRLTWNPAEYDGIEEIYVHRDSVWFPDNSVTDAQTLSDTDPEYISTVKIRYDGKVSYDHSFYAQITCIFVMSAFPFDKHVCGMNFVTYSYPSALVDVTGKIRVFDFVQFTSNGEWLVVNVTTSKERVGTPDFRFDNLNFSIHMKRNPHFFIYVIVVPCFILTFLSVIGMFWTSNVKEEQIAKLSVGLTSLMSMTVLLDMVSQEIPKTVVFPLLGIYVIICVVIIGVASMVIVMFTSKEDPEKEERQWTIMERTRSKIFSIHFGLLLLFQRLNIANFIVLMAHWT